MNYDLTTVLKDAPVGDWIALSHDRERIVATAANLMDAIALAKERGEGDPIMMKLPPVGVLVV